MSNDNLDIKSSPNSIRKNSSIIKLREIKSSLATPSRSGNKNATALKTLDKYAVAVKSILEKNNENGEEERMINKHIDWKSKKNPMVVDKYVPP